MTALQWIVKEAKAIKKQYPKRFAKWTDYVAQASAIYAKKHGGKSPVGKKKAVKKKAAKKKKVSGVKDSKEIKKTLAKKGLKMPHGYQTIKRKRKISGVKKKAAKKYSTIHKDTASHNVKISVMSGVVGRLIGEMKSPVRFTRINNDANGNPRYAVHYNEFLNAEEKLHVPFMKQYDYALKKAKLLGGRKFHNKQYGGGVVFQSYNIDDLEKKIINLRNSNPKIKY